VLLNPGVTEVEQAAHGPFSVKRLTRFARAHLGYALWLPLLLVWGTFMHEGAHAVAAVSLGGAIDAFNVLPSWDLGHFTFGYVHHVGADASQRTWILVAPVIGAAVIYTSAGVLVASFGRPGRPWKSVSILFCLLPLVDASMAVSGLYAPRTTSDMYRAFAGAELQVAAVGLVGFALAGWGGWRVFAAACGRVLTPREYAVAYCAVVAAPWLTRIVLRG